MWLITIQGWWESCYAQNRFRSWMQDDAAAFYKLMFCEKPCEIKQREKLRRSFSHQIQQRCDNCLSDNELRWWHFKDEVATISPNVPNVRILYDGSQNMLEKSNFDHLWVWGIAALQIKMKVRASGADTMPFEVHSGVRRGRCLTPTLFNFIIDWIFCQGLQDYPGG